MEWLTLGVRHRLVRDVASNDVLEQVRQVWFGRFHRGEIRGRQGPEVCIDQGAFGFHRMRFPDHTGPEDPPDHRGHFETQLLTRGEAVQAADDHALYSGRQIDPRKVANGAGSVADADYLAVH